MGTTATPPEKILEDLDLISREDLARATGRSIRMLKRDAVLRRGPKPLVYGQKVFYRRRDVKRHFDALADERTA